jgi:hypothetical protein
VQIHFGFEGRFSLLSSILRLGWLCASIMLFSQIAEFIELRELPVEVGHLAELGTHIDANAKQLYLQDETGVLLACNAGPALDASRSRP